ncbi:MarR family winged helix-turn-helix transcriptional regulator [Actinomadura sp. HBU206391]|uniref:MarR family winged helix-turn-helix transcriptional regulator n=1 Tax=Actinomadura sp. HBU206391 TaxID=2731692 RepID=UPI00164F285A|nr:MarR family winged helix-turn-helix transcriptional regulator [Actinomadura sp. HBU206391]MBC6463670.1 winged helix-turn-helix transcriptional regulator [Actinomadura sp. HBU206391]
MPTDGRDHAGPSVDEGVRTLLLLMPRVVGRIKRSRVPRELQSLSLAPRHLSLLAYLLFDGPMSVNELADRLEIVPATASLMIGDLSRQGVIDRREDEADRRRTIVSVADDHRTAVEGWLAKGAEAWKKALQPLTPAQRRTFIDTLHVYERELNAADGG